MKHQQPILKRNNTGLLLAFLGCTSLIAAAIPAAAQPSSSPETAAEVSPSSVVPAPRITRPTLTSDSQGEVVLELQAMLQLLGFYAGPMTGRYDDLTRSAVATFQTAAGLTPDGIVGPATWSRLIPAPDDEAVPPTAMTPPTADEASAPPTDQAAPSNTSAAPETSTPASTSDLPLLRLGMEGDAVTQLQQRLKSLGFYQGPIDGIFGSQTEAAVKAAQEQYELTPDGIVGPATWNAIGS